MDITSLLTTVAVSALSGGGIVALGAKTVATKWLDNRFNRNLEKFKQEGQHELEEVKIQAQREIERSKLEHTTQIEALKFERANLLDRDAKLNQREFEVIPKIWAAVTKAHLSLLELFAEGYEYVDISNYSGEILQYHLSYLKLNDLQMQVASQLTGNDRQQLYIKFIELARVRKSDDAVAEMISAIMDHSIFVHPDTSDMLESYMTLALAAYGHYQSLSSSSSSPVEISRDDNAVIMYKNNGGQTYRRLAKYLRERYWIKPGDSSTPDV